MRPSSSPLEPWVKYMPISAYVNPARRRLVTTSPRGLATGVAVTIATNAQLLGGASQQFTAQLTGSSNTSVDWTTSEPLGTISATRLYVGGTTPASIQSPRRAVSTPSAPSEHHQMERTLQRHGGP